MINTEYGYTKMKDWKTPLCHCDSESCILAYLLPCHIYSKLWGNYYLFHFVSYGLLVTSIYNMYYWMNYIVIHKCPSLQTEYCIGLGENCSEYYMFVNGIPSRCVYEYHEQICTYNTLSCIEMDDYKKTKLILSLFFSFSYVSLFLMNYFVRRKVKRDNDIEEGNDLCESTLCSLCGLAQEYREIN
jgi:hypothetical protein